MSQNENATDATAFSADTFGHLWQIWHIPGMGFVDLWHKKDVIPKRPLWAQPSSEIMKSFSLFICTLMAREAGITVIPDG